MTILQVCAFAAPTPGNFINTLIALENSLHTKNIKTIYAFPERARETIWCQEIIKRTKVYFLPEKNARINIDTYRILKKIFKNENISLVHSHFELYDIPVKLTAPEDICIFWHLHDALENNFKNSSLSRKILTYIQYKFLQKNTKLISCSKKHSNFAIKLGYKNNNVFYLPNGIDTNRIQPSYVNKSNNTQTRFLMFGWDYIRKGVDLILKATSIIETCDYKIFIVGNDACKNFIESNNPSKVIDFIKPEQNVNLLYKKSDVFLHISKAEGLSYALLEAIYAGLPVICSDIPENKIAEEFKNIFWIKNNSVDDLIFQIKSFINKNIINSEDIEFNRQIITEKYSIDSWVKNIINIYLL